MKKIDILLSHGMNDIAIFGGFGPDDLDTYFELRRYYKINFSIDAESKLKTNGEIDIEKTKQYLQQLIRFDNPKEAGIEQTRTFLQQNRTSEWEHITIEGGMFSVHPAVFNPGHFPSTAWYAQQLAKCTQKAEYVCEVGSGTGVVSCIAALRNPTLHVVATDINPFAVENTKLNAEQLGISDRVEVIASDVFDNLERHHQFDSIFWSTPFGFLDPGAQISIEEMQVFDPGYTSIRKFFRTAKQFLKPEGKLLIGFSPDLGNKDLLEELAKEYGIRLTTIAQQELTEKETITFELLEGTYK